MHKYGCIISFHYLVLQTKAMYQTCPKYFHFIKIDNVKGKIKCKSKTRLKYAVFISEFEYDHYDMISYCSSAIYYCALYRYLLHLKQTLCHLCPPASFSSAAYTARSHLGHFDTSGALNGIVTTCKMKRNAFLYYGNKTFFSDFVQKNISKI